MATDSEDETELTEDSGFGLGDTLKKILTLGAGAAFMTEEGIRSYLGEVKLPKDILNGLLQGAAKSKEDLVNRVSGEILKMLKQVDFSKEIVRFARGHKVKVSAEIEFEKKAPQEND